MYFQTNVLRLYAQLQVKREPAKKVALRFCVRYVLADENGPSKHDLTAVLIQ